MDIDYLKKLAGDLRDNGQSATAADIQEAVKAIDVLGSALMGLYSYSMMGEFWQARNKHVLENAKKTIIEHIEEKF